MSKAFGISQTSHSNAIHIRRARTMSVAPVEERKIEKEKSENEEEHSEKDQKEQNDQKKQKEQKEKEQFVSASRNFALQKKGVFLTSDYY